MQDIVAQLIYSPLTWFAVAMTLGTGIVISLVGSKKTTAEIWNFDGPLVKTLLFLGALLWAALFLTFLAAAFWDVAALFRLFLANMIAPVDGAAEQTVWSIFDPIRNWVEGGKSNGTDIRWYILTLTALTAALAATVALPFTLIRTRENIRANDTAVDQLFNDKVNIASQNLAATKQVSRTVGTGEDERVLTSWQDDLVTRNAAIDRLESLIDDQGDEAQRIANQLSVYVREMADDPDNIAETAPKDASPDEIKKWAQGLSVKRSDVEAAAQALGRIQQTKANEQTTIDLRKANLQSNNLAGLTFKNADLIRAELQGAHLSGAEIDSATSLSPATLLGAGLREVDFTPSQVRTCWQRRLATGRFVCPMVSLPVKGHWPTG